ncbi:hypothetical protein SAMN05216577_113126 [Pseudomonas citronellolis]|uniref:Uncharacterized protein n=1 Tax=Pseudomonas citronellolis TaxID=53408 RepID=A0AAQ1HNB4_9PSED|nr:MULTISPECIES: hypothetical protein [Pseudomonas]MCL6692673.1 hypothetical protein [Pseudomonas sp. R3.Fl]MCP1603027.1 hypothetical protein [Pseudomonas citronellolis]MCP1645016.1 hypothetical protein [Pseudomonas citronellolis]MCP1654085.1 hypothetical protein [Pseudomonas citronellolis]MCP1667984.1 hypothetical protein [Pseudomonas citronellolis]
MSKLLKWGLLGIVAVALIIKVSLWLSVRSIVDDAVARLSPMVEITYGGISSSFDGRVGLKNVEIRVPAARDSLKVAHAQLRFNGLRELLSFKERLAEGKLPKQMAMELTGVELQVHGPFMQALYQQPAESSVFTAMSEVACGNIRNIGSDELLQMGYRTLESDIEFSYLFEPGAQKLTFNLRSDARGMLDTRVGMSLSNVSERPGDMRVNPPRVSQVTVELDDNQYQRKVQEFCAARLGVKREEYLKQALAQFDKAMRSQRVALDQPLLDAYARYLADPQSLRLELNPSEGMTWSGLQFFEAKDVVGMLRPVVLVNQQAVNPIGFAWVDPLKHKVTADSATQKISAEETVESEKRTQQYGFVSIDSLAQYTGKRLQFITFDGAYYQGVLHKVENGRVYITVLMGTGSAEMNLRLNKINQVRVEL